MNTHPARILRGGLGLALLALAGCGERKAALAPVPAYVRSPQAIWRLRRVVLVELDSQAGPPEVAKSLSESVRVAFGARRAFTLDSAPASEPGVFAIAPSEGPRLTLEQLAKLRSAFGCDAVMIGSVDGFAPYPDARLAVRLWLIDLRSGRLLWGVDHAWQVSDPATAEKMNRYFGSLGGGDGDDAIRLAQMSPRAFGEFVAWDLARALPVPPGTVEATPRRTKAERVYEAARNICTN